MLKSFAVALTAVLALSTPVLAQTQPEGMPMPTPSKSGYAPVNGVEVYYAVYGEGEPVVLLHGGFGAIEMFGPVLDLIAKGHQVIGIDLQAHGRTLPMDRPISFEAMATDVAELIAYLGYDKADIMGYSTGGGVALRTALDHPEVVDKLILVSTPYAFSGWHDFNQQGMRMIGEASIEPMKQSPMYQAYAAIAPEVANWDQLILKMGAFIGLDYDWSAEIATITAPTLLIVGDWDSVRTAHAVSFFELLGGGKVDAGWDGANMTSDRLAILPGQTHYTIFSAPELAETAIEFLDAK